MINQLNRRNGQPTPYFVIGPPGLIPHSRAHLTLGYGYLCSPHCRGVPVPPWLGSAAAVAPMVELKLVQQVAQDQAEFAAEPHANLDPNEQAQWRRLYAALMAYNPEEPQNLRTRQALRRLHQLAIGRLNYYANLRWIVKKPPPPNRGPPDPDMPLA